MGLTAPPFPLVVDASFLVDALTGEAAALADLESWASADRTVLVPGMCWVEIANALLVARGRPRAEVVAALRTLELAGIETADRGTRGVEDAVDLADHHGLTVYDAMYLQLVLDVDGELATRDRRLAAAADAEQVLVRR